MAFHEPDLGPTGASTIPVPTYDRFRVAYDRLVAEILPVDAPTKLASILAEAGLMPCGGFCERTVGIKGMDVFFRWRAATYAALLVAAGRTDAAVDVQRLSGELHEAVGAVHAQVLGPDQWCLWGRR